MSKAKVIIVEDEFFAAEHLKELVSDLSFEVVGIYHRGEDFLKNIDREFDFALLDIFLSGQVTGLDIATEIRSRKKPFIFITANKDSQTLKEAAKLGPSAYISKPFQANDVMAALEILANQLPKLIKVNKGKGFKLISPDDVVFVKSDGAYIEIQTKSEKLVQRKLLKEIENELPEFFIRVHRSFLVNKNYIERYNSMSLTVLNQEIPISRSYKENFDSLFS